MLNFKFIKTNLVLDEFVQADLRPSTLVSGLKNKKKDYFNKLSKAISRIKDHINAFFYLIFEKKTFLEI